MIHPFVTELVLGPKHFLVYTKDMKELFQRVKIILILETIPHEVLHLLYPNDLNKGYKSYCCINNVAPPPKEISYHAFN